MTTPVMKQVMRLYRQTLKTQLDWAVDRQLWMKIAVGTRERFEVLQRTTGDEGKKMFQQMEQEVKAMRHPDPYTAPTNPGGSKYQRNLPPPLEICKEEAMGYKA